MKTFQPIKEFNVNPSTMVFQEEGEKASDFSLGLMAVYKIIVVDKGVLTWTKLIYLYKRK
ncbi:hypothetical protein [Bacillus cereus group sp. BfR-BA-01380]|uniref:hypothetical protein n=1 Tax=Bacillus cereus group sp. BfR-BA-01380 TaxID=2920324 RepID=UPI001F59F9E0|nr:hypothetical protein [Bacillus cereus group sp. BfR-BA-01380]